MVKKEKKLFVDLVQSVIYLSIRYVRLISLRVNFIEIAFKISIRKLCAAVRLANYRARGKIHESDSDLVSPEHRLD